MVSVARGSTSMPSAPNTQSVVFPLTTHCNHCPALLFIAMAQCFFSISFRFVDVSDVKMDSRNRSAGGATPLSNIWLSPRLQTVYQVVGESLAAEAGREDSDQQICHNFELFVAPPTRVLGRDSTSIKDAHVTPPACVLHLRWESEEAVVADWAKRLEDGMENVTSSSRHPRVPFSSRY